MRFAYKSNHLVFLREQYQVLCLTELTEAFNKAFSTDKSITAIKSTLSNYGITCNRKIGKKKKLSLFTEKQVEFILNHCANHSQKELTIMLNNAFSIDITHLQIRAYLKNHHINSGRTGHFEKGHKPWCAGTVGLCQPNSGSFRKGNIPYNLNSIGHERIDSKDGYRLVKIVETDPRTGAPTRYKAKHIVEYEKKNGPVPDGFIVTFIDGDKLNCDPENLEIVSKSEHLHRNRLRISDASQEERPTIRVLAKHEALRFKKINKNRTV